MTIYKGDDTSAFGNSFLEIKIKNPYEFVISKAIFLCGHNIKKEFENPQFPLIVNFDSSETKQLCINNECYLVVFDELGRQKTCKGSYNIKAKEGVYNG